ncbi:chromosome partitioning protein [Bathymodiolus platifrons methanotrophic gill symbiont]|uniref:AAA family ATPase n=1 Tax=Bathymodiolus platifrons methanotrophic gill symbiont TaxID=113268 RepID=UPI000B662F0E|nr:AAA family ATPase [Bathymodiolus platifrons methanotrophic gill symbiont]GAW86139.1 chromosome partitioning protein [Bathymodiolus platifrons methanotrophic gill symbiont]
MEYEMIILIGSQKGGVGKSTISVNLSAALATQGKDVVLVDTDRQSSSSNWAEDRSENPKLPVVNCIQKYDNIRASLVDLNSRYEYVIVDAAGRDSRELRTGLVAADVFLMPVRPSQFDLDTIPTMRDMVSDVKEELNPTLKFFAVLSMGPTNPIINESEDAQRFFSEYPDISLLSTIIRERKVYRDSISSGRGMGVIELDNTKAKHEINSVINEVLNNDI